jgi:hypothetical protein
MNAWEFTSKLKGVLARDGSTLKLRHECSCRHHHTNEFAANTFIHVHT